MATPRNRIAQGPDELLATVLFGPLPWPGRTVRLGRNSLLDYRDRPTSAQVSVAELYHEHSKLAPQRFGELVASTVDPAEVRRTWLRRRALLAASDPGEEPAELAPWRELLVAAAGANQEYFFAVDVRLVAGDGLVTWEPSAGVGRLLKRLGPGERGRLEAALAPGELAQPPPGEGILALLVACFPRNEILYGPRGYRRTLLEAGQITEALSAAAAAAGREVRVHQEFFDLEVDRIMEVDGVESSTVVAVTVR